MKTAGQILEHCNKCHEAAKQWWHDIETGEPLDRNVGELLCLIHSEISEAFDAWDDNLMDDKLPNRKGVEVELADTAIRIGDLISGKGVAVDELWELLRVEAGTYPFLINPSADDVLLAFNRLNSMVSSAMEGHRKNKMDESGFKQFDIAIIASLFFVFSMAEGMKLDIDGAIEEKMAFNAQRADHKVENRLKDDGKKY